jgi:hypothetical protein
VAFRLLFLFETGLIISGTEFQSFRHRLRHSVANICFVFVCSNSNRSTGTLYKRDGVSFFQPRCVGQLPMAHRDHGECGASADRVSGSRSPVPATRARDGGDFVRPSVGNDASRPGARACGGHRRRFPTFRPSPRQLHQWPAGPLRAAKTWPPSRLFAVPEKYASCLRRLPPSGSRGLRTTSGLGLGGRRRATSHAGGAPDRQIGPPP